MKIEKIKSQKIDFYEGAGPAEIITLGIQVENDHSYILGKFYFGPSMMNHHKDLFDKTEDFIDTLVEMVNYYNENKK